MIVSRYLIQFKRQPSGEFRCVIDDPDGGYTQIVIGLIGLNDYDRWAFTPEPCFDYAADALRIVADFLERLNR